MAISKQLILITVFTLSIPFIAQAYDADKYATETKIVRDRIHELYQHSNPEGPKLAAFIEEVLNHHKLGNDKFFLWFVFLKDKDSITILKEYKEFMNQQYLIIGALWVFSVVCIVAYQIYTHNR